LINLVNKAKLKRRGYDDSAQVFFGLQFNALPTACFPRCGVGSFCYLVGLLLLSDISVPASGVAIFKKARQLLRRVSGLFSLKKPELLPFVVGFKNLTQGAW
jgi:hypothetical protein